MTSKRSLQSSPDERATRKFIIEGKRCYEISGGFVVEIDATLKTFSISIILQVIVYKVASLTSHLSRLTWLTSQFSSLTSHVSQIPKSNGYDQHDHQQRATF